MSYSILSSNLVLGLDSVPQYSFVTTPSGVLQVEKLDGTTSGVEVDGCVLADQMQLSGATGLRALTTDGVGRIVTANVNTVTLEGFDGRLQDLEDPEKTVTASNVVTSNIRPADGTLLIEANVSIPQGTIYANTVQPYSGTLTIDGNVVAGETIYTSNIVPLQAGNVIISGNLTAFDVHGNALTVDETVTANRIVANILTTDQIVANTDSGEGILDANLLTGHLDGDIVFLDGHLDMTTLSADDITLAGNSLLAEIAAIKNTDLSSFTVQDGTAAAPSIAFQSDPNTGLFRSDDDTVALAAGGVAALSANATHVSMSNVVATSVSATTVSASDVLINGNSATTLRTDVWLQSTDGQDRVYYASGGATQFNGNVEADRFIGDGQFLSNIATTDASTLTSGTLSNALLPQDISIQGDLTANAVYGNLDLTNQSVEGDIVFLDGHLDMTTLSADDITLAGNSLLAEIAAIKNTALSSFKASDARLKTDIRPIDHALDKVCQLQGVHFTWKEGLPWPPHRDVGVLAQDVERVLPEAVTQASFDVDVFGNSKSQEGYMAVDGVSNKITALLIQAVKELYEKVEMLEKK
jgi:hypothetical protein